MKTKLEAHTRTPWKSGPSCVMTGDNERTIATVHGHYRQSNVDTDFIVEACNNYAALKKSHAELLSFCKAIAEDQSWWTELQKAISAAEKLEKGV